MYKNVRGFLYRESMLREIRQRLKNILQKVETQLGRMAISLVLAVSLFNPVILEEENDD